MKIEKYNYTGKVYNIEVEPNHKIKDDQFFINADNGVVVHNCHPRDNIALRWLAQEYDVGYDLFDTIMLAREKQARNLAKFLFNLATETDQPMPIVIHGKAYKPDVSYCIGSYSTLIGHYLVEDFGVDVKYVDPMADDKTDVIDSIDQPSVILLAHNRKVTYGYTGNTKEDSCYAKFPTCSIIVDPWRQTPLSDRYRVVHYGNTRNQ